MKKPAVRRGGGDDAVLAALAALRDLRGATIDEAALAAIRTSLGAKSARVVAAAARLVAEHDLAAQVPLLAPAFARFVADPVKRDPGCVGKQAIVEALVELERDPDDVLLAAVRYRQPEPAWGPPVDSAVSLRAHAALGLANLGHPRAAKELALLLTDKEWVARAGAAHALGAVPSTASVPLLRYKALSGDDEPRVLGECFAALLTLEPMDSVAFVADFLAEGDAVAEQAAIALGESHTDAAFARLRAWRDTLGPGPASRVALVAIGLLRSDASRDYLLAVVREGERRDAVHAAEALAIFRHDPRLRELVLTAARRRGDKVILTGVERALAID